MLIQCHCGNIQLEAELPAEVTICNCSICSRYQALWGYYQPEQVQIRVGDKGEDFYIWGDRLLEFVRCKNCGCVTHYRTVKGLEDPTIAINFRMSQDERIAKLPVRYFNGKELN